MLSNNNIELLMQPSIVTGLNVTERKNDLLITWNRVNDVDLLGFNFKKY